MNMCEKSSVCDSAQKIFFRINNETSSCDCNEEKELIQIHKMCDTDKSVASDSLLKKCSNDDKHGKANEVEESVCDSASNGLKNNFLNHGEVDKMSKKQNVCDINPNELGVESEDRQDFLNHELNEILMPEVCYYTPNKLHDEIRNEEFQYHNETDEQSVSKGFSEECDVENPFLNHFQMNETNKETYSCDSTATEFFEESNDGSIFLNTAHINEMCEFVNNSTSKRNGNHSKEKRFVCDMCQKGFSHKSHFNTHILSHTGERPFVCNVCQKGFSRKTVLNDHMRIHTGEKPFLCDICDKGFAQKNHLMRHLITHTGERRFVCDVCQKRFSDRSHLDRHILIHSGEKPYSCDICFKRFSQGSGLNSHLRTHTGEKIEKTFTCDICQKDFAYRNLLNIHIRSHTGEKFFCGVCRKGFSQKSDLTVHFRTHTGEKPFPCSVCGKRFARRSHLKTHLRIHTGEKPEKRYTCDICQKGFSQRCMMRKHRLIHKAEPSFILGV